MYSASSRIPQLQRRCSCHRLTNPPYAACLLFNGLHPHSPCITWITVVYNVYILQTRLLSTGRRLERPSSPRRICVVTRGFQTTTQNLSVFPFLPRHYHILLIIITNEKVILSRKRCWGTLRDYKKGEISKCQSKLWMNRNVFSWCLNGTREETVRRADGRLFHARGAATGKARSPRVDLCTGETTSVVAVDDRR